MKARFYLQQAAYGRGIEVRLASLNHDGHVVGEAQPVIFNAMQDQDAALGAPLVVIRKEAAQNLMDELWFLGFRPERGEMSVGQVAATEKHLQDMRSIAFAKLEVPKP